MSAHRPPPPATSASTPIQSHVGRTALAVISASGSVVVDAGLPVSDLIGLAEAAAKFGASITLRRASVRGNADLERIARAGRGRVTFDLSA